MPNGTLTVVDRTVFENYTLKPTEEDKFKKHENNYAVVGLAIFPFGFGILVVLESLAPWLHDFYVLCLFWNSQSMMISGNLLDWHCFALLIAPSFGQGVLDRLLQMLK